MSADLTHKPDATTAAAPTDAPAADSATDGDLLNRLKAESSQLSARESRAARHLFANFPMAGLGTVADFAEASGVSTATILRLVKRLGFANYALFQTALKSHLETRLQSPLTRFDRSDDGESDQLDVYFGQLAQHMETLRRGIDREAFDAVVALLADTRRDVHVIGGRYSGSIAQYFGDLLMALRAGVTIVNPATQKRAQYLLDIGRNSVVLVFDVRRYQQDVIDFAAAAAERRAKVVVMTDPWLSPAARHAAHVLSFPVASSSVFDVLTCGTAVAEALLGAVARRLGDRGRDRIAQLEALRTMQTTPIRKDQV